VTAGLPSVFDAPTHELERVAESVSMTGILGLVEIFKDDSVEDEIQFPNLARGTAVEKQSTLFLPQNR